MRVVSVVLSLLLAGATLTAQVPGDSVRFQLLSTRKWHVGRIDQVDSTSFTLRYDSQNEHYARVAIRRMYIWKRKSPTLDLVLGAIAGIVAWQLPAGQGDHGMISGSEAGDVAIGAGLGLLGGLLNYSLDPGGWHRVRFCCAAAP